MTNTDLANYPNAVQAFGYVFVVAVGLVSYSVVMTLGWRHTADFLVLLPTRV